MDRAAREIAAHARAWYVETAGQVADVEAFEAVLEGQLHPAGAAITGRALTLAARGRPVDAHRLLADAEVGSDRRRREVGRVSRQLSRWEAAGQPTPPAFEVTLARLPPPPELPEATWHSVRQRVRRQRQARAAVRRHGAGRSVGELTAMLATEYARRGVTTAPLVVLTVAARLHPAGGPYRRTLRTWTQLRAAAAGLRSVAGQIRDSDPPPHWRARPDTAVYRARTGTDHVLVALDDDGRRLLSSHLADTPGAAVVLDVWFTTDAGPDGRPAVEVHVGADRAGRLDAEAAADFLPDIEAAAELYDEQVYQTALALRGLDGAVHLQLARPPGRRPPS